MNWSKRASRGLVFTAVAVCSASALGPARAYAQLFPDAEPPGGGADSTPTPTPPPPPPPETPPPPPAAPPLMALPPPPPPPVAAAPEPAAEPLAGFSDGTAFLRSPDNLFILFPSGRLQIDSYFFHTGNPSPSPTPTNTFLLRRARLETTGWIGPFVYFYLAGDFAAGAPAAANPVAQTNLATTDDYVALAPYKNYFYFQMGQYDAPFTLENRMSDKYFDFMERSVTVRAFGIPSNKEIGAMASGYNDDRWFYYSLGVFNGDGQNFRNVDNNFDVMMRGWVAPFAIAGIAPLHDAEIGMSYWTGNRQNGLILPTQTTQAGFPFLSPSWNWVNGSTTTPTQLHQFGRLNAFAIELNAPFDHKYGVRYEFVWKHQPLSATNVSNMTSPVVLGGVNLKGYSMYGELFFWALGDDRIIGDVQGIQPFTRFKKFGVKPPQHGLMLAFRIEYLNETISEESDAAALNLGSPVVGQTKVMVYELGVNYWHSKRFRATFNYLFNHMSGDTPQIKKLKDQDEQEFLLRLAIAL
jgi:phosphate-selective porin